MVNVLNSIDFSKLSDRNNANLCKLAPYRENHILLGQVKTVSLMKLSPSSM